MFPNRFIPSLVFVLSTMFLSGQTPMWLNGGSSDAIDQGKGIGVDANGNSYVAGIYESTFTIGDSTFVATGNDDEGFIAKFDMSGAFIWAKNWRGTGDVEICDIKVEADGSHHVVGTYRDTAMIGDSTFIAPDTRGVFLAKCDSNSNFLYAQHIGEGKAALGGIDSDVSGNTYVTGTLAGGMGGTTIGDSMIDAGSRFMYVVKHDMNGNFIWTRWSQRVQPNSGRAEGLDVVVDQGGNSYVIGSFQDSVNVAGQLIISNGDYDIFLAKFDMNGQLVWIRSFGGLENDEGRGVAVDPTGDVYITGLFEGDFTYSGQSVNHSGDQDIFIAKFDTDGNLQWLKDAGGGGDDVGMRIDVNNQNLVCVIGSFEEVASFESTSVTSNGDKDVFLAKYDSDGNLLSVIGFGHPDDDDEGYSIALDDDNNSYATGLFFESLTMADTTIIGQDDESTFVVKFGNESPAQRIPTLSEWALIILFIVMLIVGSIAVRQKVVIHQLMR